MQFMMLFTSITIYLSSVNVLKLILNVISYGYLQGTT